MPALSFHFHGSLVTISAAQANWLQPFAAYFSAYPPVVEKQGEALQIQLEAAAGFVRPQHAQVEKLAETGIVSLWQDTKKATCWLYAGATTFEIHPQEGRAIGYIDANALAMPQILTNTYSLFALILLLRWRGIFHLHAAAAQLPDGRLCWISGAQRSGKTTLVTALGLAGWKPLADDSLFLAWRDEQVVWQPMRKAFHLGNEVLAEWAVRLKGLSAEPRFLDRHSVAALEFFHTTELAAQTFTQVNVVLFPEISDAPQSLLKPLATSEALRRLAEQSTFFALGQAQTKRQWEALLLAASTANCYELRSGADVITAPQQVAALFG